MVPVDETPRSKTILLAAMLCLVLFLSALVSLKLDFDNRDKLFQSIIRDSPDAMEAFQKLKESTPYEAVVLCWWDYGRAIQDLGGRKAVVAYPSRDILESVGASQNPVYALEMQLFGTYESPEKVRDVALALVLPEESSLPIMRRYGATHVMVFHGQDDHIGFNDLEKLPWIARIAGHNSSDYLRINLTSHGARYELTPKAEQVTIVRLVLDERFPPKYFAKVFENEVAKIYQIDYSKLASIFPAADEVSLAFTPVRLACASSTELSESKF